METVSNFAWHQVERWGRSTLGAIHYTFQVLLMIYLSLRAAFFDKTQSWRAVMQVVSAQIYFTGFQALPLISLLALASGSVVIMQSSSQLSLLGGGDLVGNLMVVIIIREVSPLLTALIVIARSGTAVASEIGNMRVNREIEALEAMDINPMSYVVFPRLVGGIISVICLAFYYVVIAIIGGFLVTRVANEVSFSYYLNNIGQALAGADVYIFALKNAFSGAIIFTVCSYQGLLVKQSPHEVPQVTTKAVMNSIIYVVGFNLTVTTLFYINELGMMGLL